MSIRAVLLNCTLKKSPETSNTEALIQKTVRIFKSCDVESSVIRIADHQVKFGVTSDEGGSDEWPLILEKIKNAHILVLATPIWLGDKSSICKMAIERLDATTSEQNPDNGQYPMYNKVGGALVTGNEDGGKRVSADILFSLNHSGFTIPPNSSAYWVGDAGPGPSYIEAGGDRHLYTNKNLRFMIHNLAYFARLLNENPVPTNINKLTEEAKEESRE